MTQTTPNRPTVPTLTNSLLLVAFALVAFAPLALMLLG